MEKSHKSKNNTGFRRLINATKFSWQGLIATFQTESAFRQECLAGIVLLPLSMIIADSLFVWTALIGVWLLVMLVEVLNSAIEAVVDRFGSELHPLSGKAKDAGSAAVFIALIIAALVWGATIIRFFEFFK